jgi:hypothetical protein
VDAQTLGVGVRLVKHTRRLTDNNVHGREGGGVPADSISLGITPVNAMWFVLRHYFRAALPPLPDATFWSSTSTPYLFERVP